MMKHSDFQIGREFWTGTGRWRCTDIGTRIIAAIKLDKDDASWYNGPPYAVAEFVFDEYDLEGTYKSKEVRDAEIGGTESSASHQTKHVPYSEDFELRTAFVAAVERSLNLSSGSLSTPGNRQQILNDRERLISTGAIRYFAALFYQALGQLDPDDPAVWEYAMDELADISNCEKGRRTQRDYIREVLQEPDVVIASGEGR
jgi:hypothetical protein